MLIAVPNSVTDWKGRWFVDDRDLVEGRGQNQVRLSSIVPSPTKKKKDTGLQLQHLKLCLYYCMPLSYQVF